MNNGAPHATPADSWPRTPGRTDSQSRATGEVRSFVRGSQSGSDSARSAQALVGAMCDSIGGWWCGRPVRDVLALYTTSDDTYYRAHFAHVLSGRATPNYDEARPAYMIGHLAGIDPEYSGHPWQDVEPKLAQGWKTAARSDWPAVSGLARTAFRRASSLEQQALRASLAESDAAWNGA